MATSQLHFFGRERRAGFTLIEMVIVIAMLGLLLTIALPRYFQAIDHSKQKVRMQNLATMRDAIDKFSGDQGRYPETLDELVTRHYLHDVPVDPVTGLRNWTVVASNDPAMQGVADIQSADKASDELSATK